MSDERYALVANSHTGDWFYMPEKDAETISYYYPIYLDDFKKNPLNILQHISLKTWFDSKKFFDCLKRSNIPN